MKKTLALTSLLTLSTTNFASTIAIVDTGVDLNHFELKAKKWVNPLEEKNGIDDDGDGVVDDLNGFNMVNGTASSIKESWLDFYNQKGFLTKNTRYENYDRYTTIRANMSVGNGAGNLKDSLYVLFQGLNPFFSSALGRYSGFAHGTHVAGIASKGNAQAKLMSVKLLATYEESQSDQVETSEDEMFPTPSYFRDMGYNDEGGEVSRMTDYFNKHSVDVVNGSYGIDFDSVKSVFSSYFQAKVKEFNSEIDNEISRRKEMEEAGKSTENLPTLEKISVPEGYAKEVATAYIDGYKQNYRENVPKADDTLFVYAAGNSSQNNDVVPNAPASMLLENTITVAASTGRLNLAKFSNFGVKTVHVAAPGVAINSTVPDNKKLYMSGTSMAAPYVTNLAAKIKDLNSDLSPREIKFILMETVDKKDFLKKKVISGGIVNNQRALKAAKYSNNVSLNQAVERALREVNDLEEEEFIRLKENRPKKLTNNLKKLGDSFKKRMNIFKRTFDEKMFKKGKKKRSAFYEKLLRSPLGAPLREAMAAPMMESRRAPMAAPAKAPVRMPHKDPNKSPNAAPQKAPNANPMKAPNGAPMKAPMASPM